MPFEIADGTRPDANQPTYLSSYFMAAQNATVHPASKIQVHPRTPKALEFYLGAVVDLKGPLPCVAPSRQFKQDRKWNFSPETHPGSEMASQNGRPPSNGMFFSKK